MRTTKLKESKALLAVRQIKQEIAREAKSKPDYYQRLNASALRFFAKHNLGKPKRAGRSSAH